MIENLLQTLTNDRTSPFKWHHPATFELLLAGGIRIKAPARCDYFQDPAGVHVMNSAPYLFLETEGNFVAKVHVAHAFSTVWDAAALMVMHDDRQWGQLPLARRLAADRPCRESFRYALRTGRHSLEHGPLFQTGCSCQNQGGSCRTMPRRRRCRS